MDVDDREPAVSPVWRRRKPDDEPTPVSSMYGNGLHLPLSDDGIASLLERMRAEELPDHDGVFLVDWAGVRTRIGMLPWAPQELAGLISKELPTPSDGYRSDAPEYAAIGLSLASERDTYRIVEVGAGWAPWAVMGVVLARRMGKRARGIAIEADVERGGWAMQHAADNDVDASLISGTPEQIAASFAADDAELRVVNAACWMDQRILRFPVLEDGDMGGAATEADVPLDGSRGMDYRGAHLRHVEVPSVTLETLLGGDEPTDLLHIDLQGNELDVILPNIELIAQKVRFLAVGTQHRYIEGMLMETLLPREWALLAESPSTAVFDGVKPTLGGFTVQDGNQLYANSRFRDADSLVIRRR